MLDSLSCIILPNLGDFPVALLGKFMVYFKRMRNYELCLVFSSKLGKEEQEKLLGKIKADIEKSGGKIEKEEEWGKRELAYRIKKEAEGIYILFFLKLPEEGVNTFEQRLKLEEKILRYLLVRSEEVGEVKKEKSPARRKK